MPGEGSGGAVRLGAGRAGRAGGGARGAGRVGGAGGGGGAEPVPGALELHGEGRGALLRAGERDRGALGAAGASPAPGGDRPLGCREDVVRARGGDRGPARRAGGRSCATPGSSPFLGLARRSRRSWRATRRRSPRCWAASPTSSTRATPTASWRRRGGGGPGTPRRSSWWTSSRSCSRQSPKETQERFAALLGRLAIRGRRPRRPLDARRLPDAVPRAAGPRPGLHGADAARPALTTAGLRRALVEPARKRGYRFEDEALVGRDGGVGGGGARGAAAPRLRRLAPVGEAGPGEEAADAGGLRGDRGGRGRARAARGGDPRPGRRRAAGPGAGDLPEPRHRAGHARRRSTARSCSRPSRDRKAAEDVLRAARRRAAADELRGGGGRGAGPPPGRDRARVAARRRGRASCGGRRRTRRGRSCGTS